MRGQRELIVPILVRLDRTAAHTKTAPTKDAASDARTERLDLSEGYQAEPERPQKKRGGALAVHHQAHSMRGVSHLIKMVVGRWKRVTKRSKSQYILMGQRQFDVLSTFIGSVF